MRFAPVVVAIACAVTFTAHAQDKPKAITGLNFALVRDVCIDDLFAPNAIVLEGPVVPIGCNLVDCCPRCGFTPEFEVAIRHSSDLQTELIVEFENLTDPSQLTLTPAGAASWTGNKLKVLRDVVVSGYQRDPTTDAIMARPVLKIVNPLSTMTTTQVEATSFGATIADVAITADDFPLSKHAIRLRPRLCSPGVVYPPAAGDFLTLDNNTGGDDAVVLIDAETTTTCLDDNRGETATTSSYINIQEPTTPCRNEISVYSERDAAVLLDNADKATWSEWTDAAGDIQNVDLGQAPWQMPSNVWIAAPSSSIEAYWLNAVLAALLDVPLVFDPSNSPAMIEIRAKDNFDEANYLFDINKVGIDVKEKAVYKTVTDLTGLVAIYTAAIALHSSGQCSMAAILEYQKDIADFGLGDPVYKEGELNVYYVAADWLTGYADPITGLECPGVVFVGTGGNETTLVHEFGHVFSLGHVNTGGSDCDGVAGADFGSNNIMWGGGSGRDEFTIGQSFRMNFNTSSGLNTFPAAAPVRTAASKVSCPDGADDEACVCLGQR